MAAPMTDISGYRADQGTLGQDQGLSDQLQRILTAKGPLLGAPGTVIENDLYYDVASSVVHPVEIQATFAKDRIAFNNNVIGASPAVYIPSVYFAGTVFWIPVMPDYTWPSNYNGDNTFDFCAPHGWGFNCLDSVLIYMGSSNIAQIQISGVTNFLANLATCETYDKKLAMITGAGQYLNPADKNSLIAPGQASQNLYRLNTNGAYYNGAAVPPVYPSLRQAVVPLRVPWTSMSVMEKRLSFDTKLSTQPIQITINTKNLNNSFFIGAGMTNFPNTWSSSTLQMWQEELSDKSLSVRNELLAMPQFNVAYPFQYMQSIPFDVLGTDTGLSSQSFIMNLTSIINADLTTMLFMVRWEGTGQGVSRNEPAGQFCPLYGELLTDMTLLLNGQRFFGFDANCYEYVSLSKQISDLTYPVTMPQANISVSNTNASNTSSYMKFFPGHVYELNFSRLRALIGESHLQNTGRFTNQTFQLQFKINRDLGYLSAATPAFKQGYVLHMDYNYNGVYLAGGDGGTTKLITN